MEIRNWAWAGGRQAWREHSESPLHNREKQHKRNTQVFLNCEAAKENVRQNVYSPHGEMFFIEKSSFWDILTTGLGSRK